jgi:hypothetical protein
MQREQFNMILNKISVTKVLSAASIYDVEDVLSESTSAGTVWTFTPVDLAASNFGYIVRAQVISQTTNVTPRLTMFLFNAAPTSNFNDHAANTALLHADLANYVGRIDFPAMEDLGGDSMAICTPGTSGNLPLAFAGPPSSPSSAHSLYGILVARDAFTQGAGKEMTVILQIEQK